MLKKHIKNKYLLYLADLGISLAIAIIFFFVMYNFIVRTGVVNGVSMVPTLSHGDRVVINKMAYWFKNPELGDLVAFPHPQGTGMELIKRVIGVAGDEINYDNGIVYLNGDLLPEQYRMEPGGSYSVDFPLTVPEGTVFVLGDNRWASEDSRSSYVGCIPVKNITGSIPFRIFPLSVFGFLH